MDLHYHSWGHHLPPFSIAGSQTSSDMPRSGSFVYPFHVSHSNSPGAGSSVTSSMIPPYAGSNARAHDRVQALQAYYQQQPSNSPAMLTPIISGTRRSRDHRGLAQLGPVAASTDQSGGCCTSPPDTSGRNFQEANNPLSSQFYPWQRDHFSAFSSNQIDRDPS